MPEYPETLMWREFAEALRDLIAKQGIDRHMKIPASRLAIMYASMIMQSSGEDKALIKEVFQRGGDRA